MAALLFITNRSRILPLRASFLRSSVPRRENPRAACPGGTVRDVVLPIVSCSVLAAFGQSLPDTSTRINPLNVRRTRGATDKLVLSARWQLVLSSVALDGYRLGDILAHRRHPRSTHSAGSSRAHGPGCFRQNDGARTLDVGARCGRAQRSGFSRRGEVPATSELRDRDSPPRQTSRK